MVVWGFGYWSRAMKINPNTSLKIGAIVGAVLWGGWMMWWIGSFDLATVIIFSVGSALFGFGWYVAMRFVFEGLRLSSRAGEANVAVAPRGKLSAWMVWAGLMVVTGIATACMLDLVSPFIPSGDWRWLIRSLFIIMVWPALMWSVRTWVKRYLPA
jgi:hypothetical protein